MRAVRPVARGAEAGAASWGLWMRRAVGTAI